MKPERMSGPRCHLMGLLRKLHMLERVKGSY